MSTCRITSIIISKSVKICERAIAYMLSVANVAGSVCSITIVKCGIANSPRGATVISTVGIAAIKGCVSNLIGTKCAKLISVIGETGYAKA